MSELPDGIKLAIQVYDSLSPEEKAEVDAFNVHTASMSLDLMFEELAKQPDGKHPLNKYIDRHIAQVENRTGEWLDLYTVTGKTISVKIRD